MRVTATTKQHSMVQLLSLSLMSLTLVGCGILPAPAENDTFSWEELPITYYISEEMPKEAQEEIHAAFAEWEAGLNEDAFEFGGLVELGESEIGNSYHAGKNVIFASSESGHIEAPYGDGIDAIARTFVHGASKIRDTDVVFYEFDRNYNIGRKTTGDVYSVKTVMMHEIGRMLFGDRDGDDAESVLNNPIYPQGHELEKTKLSRGDIDLFYEVYGNLI